MAASQIAPSADRRSSKPRPRAGRTAGADDEVGSALAVAADVESFPRRSRRHGQLVDAPGSERGCAPSFMRWTSPGARRAATAAGGERGGQGGRHPYACHRLPPGCSICRRAQRRRPWRSCSARHRAAQIVVVGDSAGGGSMRADQRLARGGEEQRLALSTAVTMDHVGAATKDAVDPLIHKDYLEQQADVYLPRLRQRSARSLLSSSLRGFRRRWFRSAPTRR